MRRCGATSARRRTATWPRSCFLTSLPRSPGRFSTLTRASARSSAEWRSLLLLQIRRVDRDVGLLAQAREVSLELRRARQPGCARQRIAALLRVALDDPGNP